jgi:hypothetical protein
MAMNWAGRDARVARKAALGLTLASCMVLASGFVLTGCGMPGTPLPPSLHLPDPVTDLTALRTGDQVQLNWTMTKKDTDKLLLQGNVQVRVCRKQDGATVCSQAGELSLPAGGEGAFNETLPQPLAAGSPRGLTYYVELRNRKGRSAGPSNGAMVVAGQAPGSVDGFAADVRKDGVVLRWSPGTPETAVRLHRRLLRAAPVAKTQRGPMDAPPEPIEQNMLVEVGGPSQSKANPQNPGNALDASIHFGETYEYEAQRVTRVKVDGAVMELDGAFSQPVRVDAADVFPPAVPTGLAAVALTGENGGPPAIDLSWQPDTETDLAGYIVYRRGGTGDWQRISPAQLAIEPAFHDAHVEPGHTYTYAVSAVDQSGHESLRSAPTEETVPNP